jgi:glucokinase
MFSPGPLHRTRGNRSHKRRASTIIDYMPRALGIDLGATHVKFVHLDDDGAQIAHRSFATLDSPGHQWLSHIRQRLLDIIATHRTDHIGLCAPGLASRDGRRIAWMRGRLSHIQGLDWTTFLDVPNAIPVLNDAHAALLGELSSRARGTGVPPVVYDNAVLLTLGTGVGGAILADGRLLRGHLGRAGHLGHITINADGPPDIVGAPGSLEDAIGDCTLPRRSAGRFTTTKDLVAAHLAGDAGATEIWLRSIRQLAAGITSIINAIDPQVVILGGGVASAGDALFTPLHRYLDEMEWRPNETPVPILPARLGDLAGAIGAAHNALQQSAASI